MLRNIKLSLLVLILSFNFANAQIVGPNPFTGSATPSGPAGGDLAGSYPNPTVIGATGGTLTASSPFMLTQTWNNAAVTFTGLRANITDTASAAGSLLVDIQKNSVSQFSIDKNGQSNAINSQIASAGLFTFSSRSRLASPADGQITLYNNAQTDFTALNFGGTNSSFPRLQRNGTRLEARLGDGSTYTGFIASSFLLNNNVVIASNGANSISQRNGTNAQSFSVCNTYTDGSNYECGAFDWTIVTNVLSIGTQKAGTGTARALSLMTDGASRFQISAGGNFIAASDNTYDIGASGANRPRNIYVGGQVVMRNYTVGTLPTGIQYGRAFVSDQLTSCPAIGLAMTGGGSVVCPVYYNGSAWVSG